MGKHEPSALAVRGCNSPIVLLQLVIPIEMRHRSPSVMLGLDDNVPNGVERVGYKPHKADLQCRIITS